MGIMEWTYHVVGKQQLTDADNTEIRIVGLLVWTTESLVMMAEMVVGL